MKYKALMIDLDGTTVPHFTNDVSVRVAQAIDRAQKKLTVCLVTGRPLASALPLIEKLYIDGPCVVLNGAQIYDPKSKETIYQLFMSYEDTRFAYNAIYNLSDNIMVYDGKHDFPASKWKELERVVSFYLYDISPELVQMIAKTFEHHPTLTTNRMLGSKPGLETIEIIHEKATKQFGIYQVAKLLNINTHDIIGVGDGYLSLIHISEPTRH